MAQVALEQQLVKYLADAHSIEEQALQQLGSAPRLAGDPELAAIFQAHLVETERHELAVRQRLNAHGAKPSALKGLAMRVGGVGFVLFARFQPDTPGKLAAHAFSYEHLEVAAYELLERVAKRVGDEQTVETARSIREEERDMAGRIADAFDRAVDASLRAGGGSDLRERLVAYLADAHAIEAQAVQLLAKGPRAAGDPELARLYSEHLDETRIQQTLVRERLEAHGGKPSLLKDAAMRLGALNWGFFFQAHPDTPGKLAAFAYAFEHLEVAAYEELRRVAERVRDEKTVAVADRIIGEERAAADKLAGAFDAAVDASLREKELVY
jgi:ferritin-like metal-binding protein YciE